MHHIRVAGALAAAAGTLFGVGSSSAQTTSDWRQSVSGIWYLNGNWTAGIPLDASYNARIERPGNYIVLLDVSPTINALYKPLSGPELHFNNFASMRITGGIFQNNGLTLVNAQAGLNNTYLQFNANTSIQADAGMSGELRLNANAVSRDTAYIQTQGTAVLTNTQHHRITGTGRIYASLVNNGLVRADVSGAILELVGFDKTNNAAIESVGGATLLLTDIDVIQAAAGSMSATGGGHIRIVGSVVRGGSLNASSGGSIDISPLSNLTLRSNVTSTGPINIPNATFLYVDQPAWTHGGTVNVNSGGGLLVTNVRFEQPCTVHGAQIVLNADPTNLDSAHVGTWGGALLTLGATASITGNGRVPCPVVNFGTMSSGVNQTLELVSGTKTNEGLFQTTGGTLFVRQLDVLQGANGRMQAVGGELRLWDCTVRGGRLDASSGGTITMKPSGTLTLLNGVRGSGSLLVPVGATVSINQPGWIHAGTITVNTTAATSTTKLRFGQSGTLSQANIVLNANAASLDGATVETVDASVLTIDNTCTVSGQGRLSAALVNNAPITSGAGKTIELLGGSKTNNANIKTTGGTILVSSLDVTQGAGGAFTADGGEVRLVGSTIRGGRLDALNGGVLRLPTASSLNLRDGVNSSGPILVPNSTSIVVNQPAWTHAGQITLNTDGGTSSTFLRFSQSCAVSQANVVLNAGGSNRDAATVQTLGGAVVAIDAASSVRGNGRIPANLINSGQVTCAAGQTLDLYGGIKTNNGLIRATGGTITVAGVEVHQNAVGRMVADGGQLLFTDAGVNTGQLETLNGGTAQLSPHSLLTLRSGVISSGQLNVAGGGTLAIDQPEWSHTGTTTINFGGGTGAASVRFDQDCTLRNAELRLNASSSDFDTAYLTTLGEAVFTIGPDATVSGRGNLYTAIPCDGTLSPGVGVGGVGRLNISGSLTLQSSGAAEFDIAGASQHDKLTGSTLALGGKLRVRLAGSYNPSGGEEFEIVDVAGRTGEFAELELPRFAAGPHRFVVEYAGGVVRLRARSCAPDFNADGFTNGTDFDLYVEAFEAGDLGTDVDGDGFITGTDFDMYVVAFEAGC